MPVYRATVRLSYPVGSGTGTNTWHIRNDSQVAPSVDLEEIMSWIEDFYGASSVLMPPSWSATFDGQLTEILTPEPQVPPALDGFTIPGAAGTEAYGPSAGQACVTWRSNLATRSGRGRTFVGPLAAESIQADGTLEGDALSALRGAANALVSQSNTNDNVGAVSVFSPTDSLARDIVAATVTDQVAVLRSRRG